MALLACVLLAPWTITGRAAWADEPTPTWLEIDAPSADEVVRSPIPLVELRGRVGTGERGDYDVVLALDVSQSAFLPTGLDLDGDATVGSLRFPARGREVTQGPFERWTTDPEDAVIRGEIVAAQRVLDALHPTRARVAVLRYAGRARILAPLGSVAEARAALEEWSPRPDLTGTSLAAPVERAVRELGAAVERTDADDGARKRAVLLFASDGLATAAQRAALGGGRRSERSEERIAAAEAREAALDAKRAGVLVYALEIQNEEQEDPGLLAEMSQSGDGRYVYVADPRRLSFELPNPGFVTLSGVVIENVTTSSAARAVRLFSNGEFDAFVPLAEGENRLRIRATLPDGRTLVADRQIRFERPPKDYASDTSRIEALRDELRRRMDETLALRAAPRGAAAAARTPARAVKVQVENAAPDPDEDLPDAAPGAETALDPAGAPSVDDADDDSDDARDEETRERAGGDPPTSGAPAGAPEPTRSRDESDTQEP